MNDTIAEANTLFLRGDKCTAVRLYHELAREGDAQAAFNYAFCLWRGIGTEADPRAAKSFFSFARDLEGGEAHYNLAMLYLHGEGVPRDYQKAFSHMRASAEAGCIEAQLYLGMAYTTGYLFEPDIIGITMIPFHKPEYRSPDTALLSGYVPDAESDEDARFSVVTADGREAFLWFRSAAYHDPTYVSELVAKGQFLYAKCYLDGLGTDYNRDKGVRLLLAAGKSGSQEAVEYLAASGIDPTHYLSSHTKTERRNRH